MPQVKITTGGYTRMVDTKVAKRIRIETRIIKSAIAELLKAGYLLGVHNGEETTIKRSRDARAVLENLQTTDDDYLLVYGPSAQPQRPGELCTDAACPVRVDGIPHAHPPIVRIGWVRFVYGNDGWDVICDYTTNLESALESTNALADRIADTL